jgi:Mg2+ and Co2+ transporter CorA
MKAYERIVICVVLVSVLAFFGCSKKSDTSSSPAGEGATKVDESKPIAEVKAETENMDVSSLRETTLSYKEVILSKEAEIKKLSEQLRQIPHDQQLGEEAKRLQSEIKTLTDSVSALLERFNVSYDKLKEKGGDVSGLKPGS